MRFFELHGRHEKRNVLLVELASFGEYSTQLFLNGRVPASPSVEQPRFLGNDD